MRNLMMIAGVCVIGTASANEFYWQINAGAVWPYFQQGTQTLAMNAEVDNQYTVSSASTVNGLAGVGSGYQWNFRQVSFDLGFSAYYLSTEASGVNSPFINGGSFDTLNYTVSGDSYAFLVEPKFMWDTPKFQPYIFTGVGLALNYLSDYVETPSVLNGGATPTTPPFNNATTPDVAYEAGIGLQTRLGLDSPWGVSVEYRFMGLGDATLSTYTGQPNNQALKFGQLYADVIGVSLTGPF